MRLFKKQIVCLFIFGFLLSILLNSQIVVIRQNVAESLLVTRVPTTIIVDQSGNGDYSTIQDAINSANNSDTIRIYNGTYNEKIILNKPIKLIGNGSESTLISGGLITSVGTTILANSGDRTTITINANNCMIKGFTITKRGSFMSSYTEEKKHSGIRINSNFNIITNCSIKKTTCEFGIYLYYSNNNIISQNIFDDNIIRLYFSNNNTIMNNNLISTNPKLLINTGIELFTSKNNTISDNMIDRDTAISIQNGCENNLIRRNSCINGGIILFHADKNNIEDNILEKGRCGIRLGNSNHNSIINNNCTNCDVSGISLAHSDHNRIKNNNLIGNQYGIDLGSSDHNEISGNDCKSNEKYDIFIDGNSWFNDVNNNQGEVVNEYPEYIQPCLSLIFGLIIILGSLTLLIRTIKSWRAKKKSNDDIEESINDKRPMRNRTGKESQKGKRFQHNPPEKDEGL